ncbi:MAG: 50S ribosomal protein L23 [Oscillospiraceae bacterium]|nr:50S ribosomal protein L23 [Oscillospiraceae bacterium]
MKSVYDVIIRPIVSERSMSGAGEKKYTFEVARDASKVEIRRAAEEIFGVKVLSVNTMNVRGKKKRYSAGRPEGTTPSWKKAIVRVTEDSKTIEFFDSLM